MEDNTEQDNESEMPKSVSLSEVMDGIARFQDEENISVFKNLMWKVCAIGLAKNLMTLEEFQEYAKQVYFAFAPKIPYELRGSAQDGWSDFQEEVKKRWGDVRLDYEK